MPGPRREQRMARAVAQRVTRLGEVMIVKRLLLGIVLVLLGGGLAVLLVPAALGRLPEGSIIARCVSRQESGRGSASRPTAVPTPSYDLTPAASLIGNAVADMPLEGASLLLIQNHRVIYRQAFGSYTLDTATAIASGSKWLTAATVMTLVDDGLLGLDDPIAKYLPDVDGAAAQITVRQLLSGTSGLPNLSPCLDDRSSTLDRCAREIVDGPLVAAPGSAFSYSTAGFQVAGRIAEVVTGEPWATVFQERLQEPLGMWNTTYGPGSNPVLGGGVTTTLHDYGSFLQMMLGEGMFNGRQVLSAAAVREMERNQTGSLPILLSLHQDGRRYGLGEWRDIVDAQGEAVQLSSQGDTGFSPWIDRQRHLCGVFMTEDGLDRVYNLVAQVQETVRDIVDSAQAGAQWPRR